MKKITEDDLSDYLDKIAQEYRDKFPRPDEFTINILMEGRGLTWMVARNIAEDMVKSGKATKRPGMSEKGRKCDIYKPVSI